MTRTFTAHHNSRAVPSARELYTVTANHNSRAIPNARNLTL